MNKGKPTSIVLFRFLKHLYSPYGFEFAMKLLPESKNKTYVDIGAGGFLGETTTKYIAKKPYAKLVLIEKNELKANKLQEIFPGSAVVPKSYDETYSLLSQAKFISIDLDAQLIEHQWTDFLPSAKKHLAKNTYLLVSIIHNLDTVFDPKGKYLENKDQKMIYDKSFKIFETSNVELPDLKNYCNHIGYYGLAIFDKELGSGSGYGMGWALITNSFSGVLRFKLELYRNALLNSFFLSWNT